ncbi:MAG: 4-hydroxythreonine-4-phosphate dehydrogenase PdxA, partial [Limisphaerales bacterium]
MSEKPIIAITMGDPAGVGPEVCLKAMLDRSVLEACIPVIFGDGPILERCADELGIVRQAPICKASRSG